MRSGNFYGSKFRHGIFWGVEFWSRDFWGVWLLPPFEHPCHLLKSGVLPGANAIAIRVWLQMMQMNPLNDWLKTGWAWDSQTCTRLVNSPFCITCSLEYNALSVVHYVIKVILHLLPPQGFRPEREIPRRHPSSSRVNIEVLTVQNIPSICQKKSRLPWSGAAWNR